MFQSFVFLYKSFLFEQNWPNHCSLNNCLMCLEIFTEKIWVALWLLGNDERPVCKLCGSEGVRNL